MAEAHNAGRDDGGGESHFSGGEDLPYGGKVLYRWLKANQRSQQWLADRIGVHQVSVSGWTFGRAIPLAKALLISKLTGLSMEDLAVLSPVRRESRDVNE